MLVTVALGAGPALVAQPALAAQPGGACTGPSSVGALSQYCQNIPSATGTGGNQPAAPVGATLAPGVAHRLATGTGPAGALLRVLASLPAGSPARRAARKAHARGDTHAPGPGGSNGAQAPVRVARAETGAASVLFPLIVVLALASAGMVLASLRGRSRRPDGP
jgi:hypothetical protein